VLQALTRVFGSRNDRLIKSYGRLVREAASHEPALKQLSNEALRDKTAQFRERLTQGTPLEQLLPRPLPWCAKRHVVRCGCVTSMCS